MGVQVTPRHSSGSSSSLALSHFRYGAEHTYLERLVYDPLHAPKEHLPELGVVTIGALIDRDVGASSVISGALISK